MHDFKYRIWNNREQASFGDSYNLDDLLDFFDPLVDIKKRYFHNFRDCCIVLQQSLFYYSSGANNLRIYCPRRRAFDRPVRYFSVTSSHCGNSSSNSRAISATASPP